MEIIMNGNIEYLLERINKIYSEKIVDEIINGYKVKRKTTLRVNTAISTNAEIEEELSKINCSYSKVSWYKDAYILNNLYENDIINLDIYKEGKIYLQSLSSMIPQAPWMFARREGCWGKSVNATVTRQSLSLPIGYRAS